MDNEKIIDSIDTILYKPNYTGSKETERFYRPYTDEKGKTYYKFENETVTLLKSLFEKMPSLEARELFLSNLKPNIILPFKKGPKYISSNQDFIFMLYLKIGKHQEAFNLLQPGKSITENSPKILRALLEFLSFEWRSLSKEQINKLLKDIETIQSFIKDFKNFNKKLHTSTHSSIPLWDTKKKNEYKYTDSNAVYESCQILDLLKDLIFKIKKYRLSAYLLEGINLEINQDQDKVKDFITSFGFSEDLNICLEKINQKLNSATDTFDFKGCIDLIRTFFNDLCISIAIRLENKTQIKHSETINEQGKAMAYFRKKDVKFLDTPEDKFIISFNGFLSDRVHSMTSEKEYARISKNVAIETGLFLLERLGKTSNLT